HFASFLHPSPSPPPSHSFPTRRSSDLPVGVTSNWLVSREESEPHLKSVPASIGHDPGLKTLVPSRLCASCVSKLIQPRLLVYPQDRKSTRLNSSHLGISYAVFCLKKKK